MFPNTIDNFCYVCVPVHMWWCKLIECCITRRTNNIFVCSRATQHCQEFWQQQKHTQWQLGPTDLMFNFIRQTGPQNRLGGKYLGSCLLTQSQSLTYSCSLQTHADTIKHVYIWFNERSRWLYAHFYVIQVEVHINLVPSKLSLINHTAYIDL